MPDRNKSTQTLAEEVAAFEEQYSREEDLLRKLLDRKLDEKNSFLAISSRMGTSRSYIASVPLRWFADVRFASDLDMFNNQGIHGNGDTLNILSHSQPDWRCQVDMTLYLATQPHRKFPPVLLVAYQPWVFNPDHDNWYSGLAIEDSISYRYVDSRCLIASLGYDGTYFYALDGQHRLMAVKGLQDLLNHGKLQGKGKDGTILESAVSIENVRKLINSDRGNKETGADALRVELDAIMNESICVEIIPAVQTGETFENACARLRQVFVDVGQDTRC